MRVLLMRLVALIALVPGFMAPVALTAQTSTPRGTGIILGQVVDADAGHPVAEATVTLIRMGDAPAATRELDAILAVFGRSNQEPTPPPSISVLTGADGRFVFTGLARGSVTLSASASGYITASSGQVMLEGPSRPIELADGDRRADLKLRLWKEAAITGTIIDEAGDPAVGARVTAFRRTPGPHGARLAEAGSATSDDRGVYRIASLLPGTYVVATPHTLTTTPAAAVDRFMQAMLGALSGTGGSVSLGDVMTSDAEPPDMSAVRVGEFLFSTNSISPPPPSADGRLRAYRTLFYPQSALIAEASPLRLQSGEERRGIDLQLVLSQSVNVSGTVSGPQGPLADVSVRLTPAPESTAVDRTRQLLVARAVTSADGTFTMLGVPPGRYLAWVLREPSPDLPGELASNPAMEMVRAMMAARKTTFLFGETPLTVGDGDLRDVAIVVREGLTVSGRLEFEGTSPRPTGEQLESIEIGLDAVKAPPVEDTLPLPADRQGAFRTRPYPAGTYLLDAVVSLPSWSLKSITLQGRDWTDRPLELMTTDITGVILTFTDRVAAVTGRIKGPPSTVARASAVLFPADYRTWIDNGMSSRRLQRVVADASGAYTFEDVPPREYCVAAVDDSEIDIGDPKFFEALASRASRVRLRESDKRSLDLAVVKVGR